MKCPSEVELNEFVEDRLESRRRWDIQEHLDQCPGCRTDLEGLEWVTGALAVLDNTDEAAAAEHPAEADLAALAEGRVASEQKAELLSHLALCPECARVFGRLPRKQRTLSLPRGWYTFAAAAVLLIAVGLFAFTGPFAHHRPAAVTKVATNLGGAAKATEARPATAHRALPKPPAEVAVKPTPAPAKVTKPAQLAVTKPHPAAAPKPTPTVVAQNPVTPVRVASAVAPRPVTARARTSQPTRHARRLRVAGQRPVSTRRTPRHSLNHTQLALGQPTAPARVMSETGRPALPGTDTITKRLLTADSVPSNSPVEAATHALAGAAAPVKGTQELSRPVVNAGTAAPRTAARPTPIQSQRLQQAPLSHNAATKKAGAKSAAKILQANGKKLAGQELRRSKVSDHNTGKAGLKSHGGKSSQHSGHSRTAQRQPHHHTTPLAGSGAHPATQSPPGTSHA